MKFRFIAPNLFVQLSKRRISITNLESSEEFVDESNQVAEAFDAPRGLINDFQKSLQVISDLIKRARKRECYLIKPVLVIQVREELEGGLTDVEKRPIYELFESHARHFHLVDHSRKLTLHEARDYIQSQK